MSFFDHPITLGDVVFFVGGWLTVSLVGWWRRHVAWQRSEDGGAASRRIRVEEVRQPWRAPRDGGYHPRAPGDPEPTEPPSGPAGASR